MTEKQFKEELKKINIELNDIQIKQLEKYYELLIEYNKVMNLTNIVEKDQVYLKHFYDSLTIIKIIDLNKVNSLCDIGTGAGFPGMVLKIVFPNLKVTLLDSLNKRINFLNKVIEELDLKNIETIHTRAEDYAKENRNKFDITTARAVAHLSTLLEYSIPMTKENGYFVALKGNIEQEKEEVENALKVLNSKIEDIIYFELPDNQGNRSLIKIKKEKDNKKYPRKNSEIKKNRL
jgi:16S rRNA (guanine527-N7)-methyltransferase